MFELRFTRVAADHLDQLEQDNGLDKRLKAVRKALGYLQLNPRHRSLSTHKYTIPLGTQGEEVFEAYAENRTPAAYRIFWHYGPGQKTITIIAITAQP